MKYIAGVLLLWLGFFVGAWYGNDDRECYTTELGGLNLVVCRDGEGSSAP